MMTRKHFEAIAKILRENSVDVGHEPTEHELGRQFQSELIASELADYFAQENVNFDTRRFMDASRW